MVNNYLLTSLLMKEVQVVQVFSKIHLLVSSNGWEGEAIGFILSVFDTKKEL